ncbi:BatD family protein [Agriterribacter sp.]|uniref:BatD family protein n=1 Tax=Agriterribacter sp. TaxID=2821509 RepID=UPI002CA5340F|nr:BatD family protein [Agriterribacter sp.]HTN05222.1 BatD family protein [Agriterribacter sp.]
MAPVRCIFDSGLPKQLSVCLLALLAHCLFFTAVVCAQPSSATIKASLNRDHVLIGEPIELHIEVKTGADRPVTKWFNLPDSFNHLEVLSRSPIDSVRGASLTTYRQAFTITGFDSGIWVIPAVKVIINKKTIQADSLPVTIVPVQLKDSTYHDIREIIDVPDEKAPWWYWVAGVLSLIALGVLVWLWLKSRPGKPVAGTTVNAFSPLQEAMNGLRQLAAEQLTDKGEWKKYYSVLTGIFKRYMERKFQTHAMQKTTGELLLQLKSRLDKEQVSETAEALRIADAVKFAKYRPDGEQAAGSLYTIEKTIQALDHLKS